MPKYGGFGISIVATLTLVPKNQTSILTTDDRVTRWEMPSIM